MLSENRLHFLRNARLVAAVVDNGFEGVDPAGFEPCDARLTACSWPILSPFLEQETSIPDLEETL